MTGSRLDAGAGVVEESRPSALEETILGQPEAVSRAIAGNLDKIRAASAVVAAARRVRLCGVGVSGYAAQVGELMLRSIGVDARANHAFELTVYPTNFDPGELLIVFSHRGETTFARRALGRALQSGLKTIAITGQGSPLSGAEVTIETVEQERSATHSASFTAALAVLSAVAARCEPRSALATALPGLPDSLRAMLPSRDAARDVAEVIAAPDRRTLILGAGGCCPVALAGALTIKAAAYLAVEGAQLEEALHGALHSLRDDDIVIQLAPEGPADERQADVAQVVDALGFPRWKIGGQPDGSRWHTPLPDVPDIIAPISAAIPLQWLALECALRAGTDPDSFHRDDPRWDQAFANVAR